MAIFNLDGKEYIVSGKPGDWNFSIRIYKDSYQNDVHYDYEKFEEKDFFELVVKAAIKQGKQEQQRDIAKILGLDKMFRKY
jgi:hypothetical protein